MKIPAVNINLIKTSNPAKLVKTAAIYAVIGAAAVLAKDVVTQVVNKTEETSN